MVKLGVVSVVTILLIVAEQLPLMLSFPHSTTVPALLWSPHQLHGSSNSRMMAEANYQTLSPKELAKSVMSEGGWSDVLCPGKESQQSVDIALLFVGRELHSLDLPGNRHAEPALVDLLKASFTRSNFSLAFPYIAASDEKESMENSLISEFKETCGDDFGLSKVAFVDSCSVEGETFEKLADFHSIPDYLVSRMEKKPKGQADLVIVCHGGSSLSGDLDRPRSESQIFSELISSVEQSGVKYTVLYASDPLRSIQYPSYREVERFLAEGTPGNRSSTCDEVCQIKASLLEGLLVGIVLLIILISGLCCMMGIDTPTRFETPQDS